MSSVLRFAADHWEIIAPEAAMLLAAAILWAVPATRHVAHRAIRAGKLLARSRDLPRWARYGFVLFTLPWPGPIDEIGAVLLVLALWRAGHAATVRAAWREALTSPPAGATVDA